MNIDGALIVMFAVFVSLAISMLALRQRNALRDYEQFRATMEGKRARR